MQITFHLSNPSTFMNIFEPISRFFGSSIGRKLTVAITGILLILFLIGHVLGNLQIFGPPKMINAYAYHLVELGPLLWVIRAGLLAIFIIHVVFTILLVMENRKARGAENYEHRKPIKSTWASRTMIASGLILIAFVIFHIGHFTTKTWFPYYKGDDFKVSMSEIGKPHLEGEDHGHKPVDVYLMMIEGFKNPFISIFYIVAMAILFTHLSHGVRSVFQTLGWVTPQTGGVIKTAGYAFSILLFLGFSSIPVAVMTGLIGQEYHAENRNLDEKADPPSEEQISSEKEQDDDSALAQAADQ